jgi:hypothetical protein
MASDPLQLALASGDRRRRRSRAFFPFPSKDRIGHNL